MYVKKLNTSERPGILIEVGDYFNQRKPEDKPTKGVLLTLYDTSRTENVTFAGVPSTTHPSVDIPLTFAEASKLIEYMQGVIAASQDPDFGEPPVLRLSGWPPQPEL